MLDYAKRVDPEIANADSTGDSNGILKGFGQLIEDDLVRQGSYVAVIGAKLPMLRGIAPSVRQCDISSPFMFLGAVKTERKGAALLSDVENSRRQNSV
jgi:hypothetical protein